MAYDILQIPVSQMIEVLRFQPLVKRDLIQVKICGKERDVIRTLTSTESVNPNFRKTCCPTTFLLGT